MIRATIKVPRTTAAPSWADVARAYRGAKAAEDLFYATYIDPMVPPALPPSPERDVAVARVSAEAWEEAERLSDRRGDVEDALMSLPAPDAAGLALKLRIAVDGGEFRDRWSAVLEVEAARFSAQ